MLHLQEPNTLNQPSLFKVAKIQERGKLLMSIGVGKNKILMGNRKSNICDF